MHSFDLDLCNSSGVKFCSSFPLLPLLASNEADRSSSLPPPDPDIRLFVPSSTSLYSPTTNPSCPLVSRYQDGIELDPYTLSRSPGVLTEYIDTISRRYAKRAPVAAPVTAGVGASGRAGDVKGRAGSEVVSLNQAGLEKVKQDGGFVKFFAPW